MKPPTITQTPAGADQESEATVRLARRRFARRQWARRWLAWRGVAALAALLVLVVGAVWVVFFSSALAVSDVTVEGTSVLSTPQVRRMAAVPTGEPLARVDLEAIAARVESLPPVKRVDVSRAWPDKVRIAISERVPVAVVVSDGVVRGLDDQGVLFRRYATAPAHLPVVHLGAKADSEARAEVARVVDSLPSGLAGRVDYVDAATIDTISLRMHNGRTIRWGSADESANKARILEVLLRQKASEYDVSVPGRPTIRR